MNKKNKELLWKEYFLFRELAKPRLEEARQQKKIGKDLDALIILSLPQKALNPPPGLANTNPAIIIQTTMGAAEFHFETLQQIVKAPEELRELLNVSQLRIVIDNIREETISLEVRHADGQKCERCWHWEMDIGLNAEHPSICGRCVEAVKQTNIS